MAEIQGHGRRPTNSKRVHVSPPQLIRSTTGAATTRDEGRVRMGAGFRRPSSSVAAD